MTLISLVYVSYETKKLSEDDLKDILKASRENNNEKNVTGMLLYRGGFFIQALEGEETTVLELYEKIKDDERHTGVLLVHQEEIQQRSFQNWAMGFNIVTDDDIRGLDGFTSFLTQPMQSQFFSEKPDRAHRLLRSFQNRTFY